MQLNAYFMKKISKVIFVQEEVTKSNIQTEQIQAPIVKGKIELPNRNKIQPKTNQSEMKPMFWQNFPIKDWAFYLSIAKKANEDLGFAVVTLSKKAFTYEDGKKTEDPTSGSIWFTCGSKDFKEKFRRPLAISLSEIGSKRLDLNGIRKLHLGDKFSILWIDDYCNTDLVPCEKIGGKENGNAVIYKVIDEADKYKLLFSEIDESGKGRHDMEDFFVMVKDSNSVV